MRLAGVTTVERAYQLAKSGKCQSLTEIKMRLADEGFADATRQFTSRALTGDLRRVLDAARQET